MDLSKAELDFIDERLELSAAIAGSAPVLVWKKPTARNIEVGSVAGSYDRSKAIHFTRVAGRKVPTVYIVFYLRFGRQASQIDARGIERPTRTSVGHTDVIERHETIIGGKPYNLRSCPNQEYVANELTKGIRFDARTQVYRLYIEGRHHSTFDTIELAIVARAVLVGRHDKATAFLRDRFFPKKSRKWQLPSFAGQRGRWGIATAEKNYEITGFWEASRLWVTEFKNNIQETAEMTNNREHFEGVEDLVNYDVETGKFTYKSGRKGSPVRKSGNRPCIRYNGHYLSAAKVAWYIVKGVVPNKNVKVIDQNAANLAFENLTVDVIRREKKKLTLQKS